MNIEKYLVENKIVLAPMAGVTDKAFRLIARSHGCGLIYTEMVSAKALTYKNIKTNQLLDIKGEVSPIAVQLFGSEPKIMAEAALIAEEHGADIIDINMGCPVPKIVQNGEGAALLGKPELAKNIVREIKRAVRIPVTVKIRSGLKSGEILAVEMAEILAAEGASAIAVHARSRDQYYSGKADWGIIREIKKRVRIAIIGSGDIWTPHDAEKMLETTLCDALMVGRGALGNPWLISNIKAQLLGEKWTLPTAEEKIKSALEHLESMIVFKGEQVAVREMRKHIAWYLKGLPHTAQTKDRIFHAVSKEEVNDLLQSYLVGVKMLERCQN